MTYELDLGPYSRPVNTDSRNAQQWFDRGLLWLYGFNREEAVRCFREAQRAEPSCAMAHWGEAYAAGPFINLPWEWQSAAERRTSLTTCFTAAEAAMARRERRRPGRARSHRGSAGTVPAQRGGSGGGVLGLG